MGSAQTSTEYEKFIGETEILSLIESTKILGSGYTYSGLPYVNSATTIADAYSALTNEVITNEKVGAAAINTLNAKINKVNNETNDRVDNLDDRVVEIEGKLTGEYIPITGYELATGTTEEELALSEVLDFSITRI